MPAAPTKILSLFDSTCLIVGIVIGVGIYEVVPTVAQGTGTAWGFLGIWLVGGLLSLCGALGYAELATAYPREGGDYVYLTRAYGPWAGFLFGWMQLVIVRPGDIAGLAFIFAHYGRTLYDPFAGVTIPYDRWSGGWLAGDVVPLGQVFYAVAAVVVLTAINVVGARKGKWTQNLLTVLKVVGLLAIVAIAVVAASPTRLPGPPVAGIAPWSLALILVLFAFGGWNEMAYVAAEVKNPDRNIVRALVWGTAAVTLVYVLVAWALLHVLGLGGIAGAKAVAADAVSTVFPTVGAALIAALVCISALGAANGLIFTGARISYALGADHPVFRPVGQWHPRTGTPVRALLLQGVIAVGLILLLGSFVNAILYTAAAVYTFYLATSLAVIVLRFREPRVARPYRVLGYPVTTILFCGVCVFLIYSAVVHRPWIALGTLVVLVLGVPVYVVERRIARERTTKSQ